MLGATHYLKGKLRLRLMYAGSKRAVVSLWQVSDEGTSKLMPIFYKAVLQGKAPAVALREAQLQLWNSNEWKSPYPKGTVTKAS